MTDEPCDLAKYCEQFQKFLYEQICKITTRLENLEEELLKD